MSPLPQLALAPMEGVMDAKARDLLTQQPGWDFAVTEFVRVTQERLPAKVYHRLCPELRQNARTASGVPVHLQLLGSDPECLAINAQVAVRCGAQVVDLNFGCPAKIVNRHGGGARLLRAPDQVFMAAEAVVQALAHKVDAQGAPIRVTAKMRLGDETTDLALANAQALEAAGVAQLVVHARTRLQGYRPPAHWEWIGKVADAVRLPVLANGDLWTLADYQRCVAVSGVKDAMFGRSAMADPWLAAEIKASLSGEPRPPTQLRDVLALMVSSLLFDEHTADKVKVMRTKQWLLLLTYRWGEAARAVFDQCKRLQNTAQIVQCIQAHFNLSLVKE